MHLYLKVMFGLMEFAERESLITDGSNDGGIDGYYIDQESRRIYLIQSKFRNTEQNFESKEIEVGEILVMDIRRITGGKTENSNGEAYNGKIQGLIRRISEIPNIGRYTYQVVILANCTLQAEHLYKLTDGEPATVFNFQRAYNELVFPIVSGTYFKAQEVTVRLDLSNKSAGAKTSYSVGTPDYHCEITVLFIPTLEIAKAMDKYRNTILEYNPRSYLDLEGQKVNASIRETLSRPDSNAFALMNNGITMLSDETSLNERIGQENKAQLHLVRPQIINGGQTAYTLSRIYNEDKKGADALFAGKEVLTKIITLNPKDATKETSAERLRLIEEISEASNRQTPVISSDRLSNEMIYINLQRVLFDQYGILLERKRGEFSDGVFAKYVSSRQILERNLFFRIFFAAQGRLTLASRKRIFRQNTLEHDELLNPVFLDVFADGYSLFVALRPRRIGETQNPRRYREVLAKTFIGVRKTDMSIPDEDRAQQVEMLWAELLGQAAQFRSWYQYSSRDAGTEQRRGVFAPERWMTSPNFQPDVHDFVAEGENSGASTTNRRRSPRRI